MFKKLMLATIANLLLVSGVTIAAPRDLQKFHVEIEGDISAILDSEFVNVGNNNKQKSINFLGNFTLGDWWLDKSYDNGRTGRQCFFEITPVAIHIRETRSGAGQAVFWFSSTYPTGEVVRYMLTITDHAEGWSTPFPPTEGNSTMIAEGWEMETEGRGKDRDISCKGMGNGAGVSFDLTRISP